MSLLSIALIVVSHGRSRRCERARGGPRAGYRSLRHRTASQDCLLAHSFAPLRSLARSLAHRLTALTRNATRPTRARRGAADRSLSVSRTGDGSLSRFRSAAARRRDNGQGVAAAAAAVGECDREFRSSFVKVAPWRYPLTPGSLSGRQIVRSPTPSAAVITSKRAPLGRRDE